MRDTPILSRLEAMFQNIKIKILKKHANDPI